MPTDSNPSGLRRLSAGDLAISRRMTRRNTLLPPPGSRPPGRPAAGDPGSRRDAIEGPPQIVRLACPDCNGQGWLPAAPGALPDEPGFGRLEPCRCTVARWEEDRQQLRAERMAEELPWEGWTAAFATFQRARAPECFDAARDWANGILDEPFLYLWGGTGSGKSHLGYAAYHRLLERHEEVMWRNVPVLITRLFELGRDKSDPSAFRLAFEDVLRVRFLILDDLGAEYGTAFVADRLYQILNERYANYRPTFITSNLTPEQLDGRLRSRLCDAERCREAWNASPDFRVLDPVARRTTEAR